MTSRHSAARPKRAGENFARTHHNDNDQDTKRVRFDVRNPSNLALDARDDDAVLDADVIGGGGGAKRGAINLDGYDSDSDNENFNARARARKKGDVNILEKLDNYDAKGYGANKKGSKTINDDEDDDDDMFADEDDKAQGKDAVDGEFEKSGRKKKNVQFLDTAQIQGQVESSTSGGKIQLNEEESSDDEADLELAIQEEGLDEEVGAGGRKRNAPKVEAFNLKEEMEDGGFDQAGNYIRKANDPDAVHDSWLEGLSKKEMKKAAEAHEKREAEARKMRIQEDNILVSELFAALIRRLERTETPLEALARLGKDQTKPKRLPKWKLKKMAKSVEGMEVEQDANEGSKQAQIMEAIDAITDAADKLLSRGNEEIYEQERELLVREYMRETGEDWVEPASQPSEEETEASTQADKLWEFRWVDGRDDAAKQGPFDGPTMKAWQDAGYFGQGVEFRQAGGEEKQWAASVDFA